MSNEIDRRVPNVSAELMPEEPPTAQPSALRKAFIGKDGLRAGWSLLIFIALVAAVSFSVRVIGRRLHLPDPNSAGGSAISPLAGILVEGLNFLVIFVLSWIMAKIERRPAAVYGFGDKRTLPHFFAGLVWGVACLSLLVLTLWKTGLMVFDGRLLFGSDVLRYGASWLAVFFLVGMFEEYATRGYLQYTLTRGLAGLYQWVFKTGHGAVLGFWTSALIFSILFGLSHSNNPGESPIGLLSAGLAGMVFCFSLWRTGSLWWAIGFHTSWDWAQSYLYGVPDSGLLAQHHLLGSHPVGKPIFSGGTTGPEGSILIVGMLALIALIIFATLPRQRYGAALKAFE